VTSAFLEFKVTVLDFGVLITFDSSVGTLNKQRLDICTGTRNTSGLFLTCALIVLRSKSSPRTEGNTDISTPISPMIAIAEKDLIPGTDETRLIWGVKISATVRIADSRLALALSKSSR
jgi:hypothetical protein